MPSQTKNNRTILWVAQSALLIALLVVVQLLTFAIPKGMPLVSQIFTGSLVNLVLIMGAGTVGFSGAAIAAVISPILAFLFGQMTMPPMIPVVIAGNIVIVAITWAFFINDHKFSKGKAFGFDLAGVVVGAIVKTLVLFGAAMLIVVPVFFSGKPKVVANITLMFSWPQAVTAVIGGVLALIIVPRLRTFIKNKY